MPDLYAGTRMEKRAHTYTRNGLGALAQESEGLVLVSAWQVHAHSWGAVNSWGSISWQSEGFWILPNIQSEFL